MNFHLPPFETDLTSTLLFLLLPCFDSKESRSAGCWYVFFRGSRSPRISSFFSSSNSRPLVGPPKLWSPVPFSTRASPLVLPENGGFPPTCFLVPRILPLVTFSAFSSPHLSSRGLPQTLVGFFFRRAHFFSSVFSPPLNFISTDSSFAKTSRLCGPAQPAHFFLVKPLCSLGRLFTPEFSFSFFESGHLVIE